MSGRGPERREAIARWVFVRVEKKKISLDKASHLIDLLVKEDPSLEINGAETPLSRIRA